MTRARSRRSNTACAAALLLVIASACGCAGAPPERQAVVVRDLTPAFLVEPSATDPGLAADARGDVVLTWRTTPAGGAAALWLAASRDGGATFSPALRLDQPPGAVIATAEDRPMPALGPGGAIAVAWSERRADSTGALDVRVRGGADLGRTLGAAVTVNDDAHGPPAGLGWRAERAWRLGHRIDAAHRHPALAFTPDGTLLATWVDDRATIGPGPSRTASLFAATSRDGGQTWSPNLAIADSVCPCCRPVAAAGGDGAVAVTWRDARSDVRDPALAWSLDGGRSFGPAVLVSRDGWRTGDCPGDGPAIAWSDAGGGGCVWFTGAAPPGVFEIPWRLGSGAAGMRRLLSDGARAARHGRIAPLGRSALVAVEADAVAGGRRVLAVRVLDASGALGPWAYLGADVQPGSGAIATADSARALACWVEHDATGGHVRLAEIARRH